MAKNCRGCNDPQTQEDGIDCGGVFVSDECVTLSETNVYFNLPLGSKLSQLITKITIAIKNINIQLSKKIDYTTLPTYTDNADAITGGLTINKPYKTPTGEVRVVV